MAIGTDGGRYSIWDLNGDTCLLYQDGPGFHVGVIEWSQHWDNNCLVIGSKESKRVLFHDLRCKFNFSIGETQAEAEAEAANNSSQFIKNGFNSLNFKQNCILNKNCIDKEGIDDYTHTNDDDDDDDDDDEDIEDFDDGDSRESKNENNEDGDQNHGQDEVEVKQQNSNGKRDTCTHSVRNRNRNVTKLEVDGNVVSFKWSYDGYHFAIGNRNKNVSIWDVRNLCHGSQYVLNYHDASVRAVAWSPHDYNVIATGGGILDMKICLWNLQKTRISNDDHTPNSYSITLNKPTSYWVSGSQVCNLIFDANNKDQLLSTHGNVHVERKDNDNKDNNDNNDNNDEDEKANRNTFIDYYGSKNSMILWNLNDSHNKTYRTEKNPSKAKWFVEQNQRVLFCAQSPNFKDVATLGGDYLKFWNVFGDKDNINQPHSNQSDEDMDDNSNVDFLAADDDDNYDGHFARKNKNRNGENVSLFSKKAESPSTFTNSRFNATIR